MKGNIYNIIVVNFIKFRFVVWISYLFFGIFYLPMFQVYLGHFFLAQLYLFTSVFILKNSLITEYLKELI